MTIRSITDVTQLTKLRVLESDYVTQEGIAGLVNIEELYCLDNQNITDVTQLTKLRILESNYVTDF